MSFTPLWALHILSVRAENNGVKKSPLFEIDKGMEVVFPHQTL